MNRLESVVIHALRETVLAPSQALLYFLQILQQVLKYQINKLITISTHVITLPCHLSIQTLQTLSLYLCGITTIRTNQNLHSSQFFSLKPHR